MNIEVIHDIVHKTGFRLTGHASVEAMKDGISPKDIRYWTLAFFNTLVSDVYPLFLVNY